MTKPIELTVARFFRAVKRRLEERGGTTIIVSPLLEMLLADHSLLHTEQAIEALKMTADAALGKGHRLRLNKSIDGYNVADQILAIVEQRHTNLGNQVLKIELLAQGLHVFGSAYRYPDDPQLQDQFKMLAPSFCSITAEAAA